MGIIQAEIYLRSTCGAPFVDDLIKHLPQLSAKAFKLSPQNRHIPQDGSHVPRQSSHVRWHTYRDLDTRDR
jgi:hypothetical protein